LIVAYETAAALAANYKLQITSYKCGIAKLFVVFSVIESIIGFLQFYKQASLGLYKLGESHLSASTYNVAKLVVDGHTYIRAYGTFPHPNLLSAFLVTGVLLSIFLFISTNKKWQILWGISIFINILGLTITFSRGAYLALTIGLFIYFGFFFSLLLRRGVRGEVAVLKLLMTIAILIVSTAFSFLLFRSFLLTRVTISDNAVVERIEYNKIGLNMIQANPIFGVGAGESVLHMEQYADKPLEPWQKQPIHNYFLLSAAELGLPGALILIWILISHFFRILNLDILKLFRNCLPAGKAGKLEIRNLQLGLLQLTTLTILFSFLILMMFDHYFYTLQQTQLLLWIILGIIASQEKNPRTGD
jgi:O-antigen ligase